MSTVVVFALLGAGTGALYALQAVGLVLTYRGSGVLNFASGAMGMVGAFVFWEARPFMPTLLAAALGVAVAGALGLLTHLLIAPLRKASSLTRIVLTLAVLVVLTSAMGLHFSAANSYPVAPLLPTGPVAILGGHVGLDRMILIVIAIAVTGIVWLAYRLTRFGLATTAVSENPEALASLGWSPTLVAAANWTLGGMLSGVAAVLIAPVAGLSVGLGTALLLPAIASAVLGDLTSFPLVLLGGLAIGIFQSELARYVQTAGVGDAVPFAVIILVIAVRGRRLPLRSHVSERLPRVTNGTVRLPWVAGATVAGILLLWFVLNVTWVQAATFSLLGILLLQSVVVVTGFGGQISLSQTAIAATGGLLTAHLLSAGVPTSLAMLAGIAAGLPIGLVVGALASRARGFALAIATLAFGVCIGSLVLDNSSLDGGLSGIHVGYFKLLGVDLDATQHPRRFAILVLVVAVLVGLGMATFRRGRAGRRLLAVRSNERASAALGISVREAKVAAFIWGAVIACIGGVLVAVLFPDATFSGYDPLISIQQVSNGVLGGVGYVTGVIPGGLGANGGVFSTVVNYFGTSATQYIALALGVLTVLVVMRSPDGVVAVQAEQINHLLSSRRPSRAASPASALPATMEASAPAQIAPVLLTVENLRVSYGGIVALDGVSLTLKSGEVLGIIGPNGAGKTTLIDAITGFMTATGGSVMVDGRNVTRLSPHLRSRLGIVRTFQSGELLEDISVFENLRVAADARDRRAWITNVVAPGGHTLPPAARQVVAGLGLGDVLDKRPEELSNGRRRLVSLARAIAAEPRVLLLDEPAAGLDERECAEFLDVIAQLAGSWKMAILLIEHDVALVRAASDRVLALDFGRAVASGTPAEVTSHPAVLVSYLGEEAAPDETSLPVADPPYAEGAR